VSGELPEGWAKTTLKAGLIASIQTGFACGKHSRDASGVAHVRPMNVSEAGQIVLENVKYVDAAEVDRDERWLRHGDVVFNNTNSPELVGKTAFYDLAEPRAFSNHMTRLRCTGAIDAKFCAFLLHHRWQQREFFEKCNNHVSQASVGREVLLDTALGLPPLPEQRRIVTQVEALLEQVNRAKGRLERVMGILKRFRQAVLAAACSGELTREWRQARGLTQPWRDVELGELLREPLRNGHSAKQSADGTGVPTFSLTAFTNGDFSKANVKMTVADPRKTRDLWAKPDDIYVERSNTPELVGTARLYDGPSRFAIVPDLVIRVRLREEEAVPRYVEHCLRSKAGRDYFIDRAQGTSGSMPKIDQAAVLAFPVSLPHVDEQAEIVRRVAETFALADTIERCVLAASARADSLPQAVLAKAFSGELVPTEAELARAEGRSYETAEELLKRGSAGKRDSTRRPAKASREPRELQKANR